MSATSEQTDAVGACNALTARWVRKRCDGSSTVLSGAGVWPLLAILAASAGGPARVELGEATGVQAGDGFAGARDLFGVLGSSAAIKAALGIWADAKAPLDPDWQAELPSGTVGRLLADGKDQERLDAWANEQTDRLIKKMPIDVTPDTLVVLASALSVNTRWLDPFDPGSLRWSGQWADGLRRETRDLDQLLIIENTPAGPVALAEVRGDKEITVYLALGDEATPAANVLTEAITAVERPDQCRRGSTLQVGDAAPGVTVEMVRTFVVDRPTLEVQTVPFALEAEHNLLDDPSVFGLQTATDTSRGHFPKMSPTPLAVNQAKQAAIAEFSAEGFQAAAVTAMGLAAGVALHPPEPEAESLRIRARFDRPFGFVAVHAPTRLILFAGWVSEPPQRQAFGDDLVAAEPAQSAGLGDDLIVISQRTPDKPLSVEEVDRLLHEQRDLAIQAQQKYEEDRRTVLELIKSQPELLVHLIQAWLAENPSEATRASGLTRTAMFLITLGSEAAAPLLLKLNEDELERLTVEITQVMAVSSQMAEEVMAQAVSAISKDSEGERP